jgi:hypothetical protein
VRAHHDVEWSGDRVSVREGDRVVASGRWIDGHIVERSGAPGDGSAGAWEELEARVRAESEALVGATTAGAYDERGVDVTQIDRMLSLTPRERLEALDTQRRAILRLTGDAPRD